MPATATMVLTNLGKNKMARIMAGQVSYAGGLVPVRAYFIRVGIGGHNPDGSPKEPDPTRTSMENDSPAHNTYLVTPAYSFAGGLNIVTFTAMISMGWEIGNTLYEVGLFDQQWEMIAYGTFPAIVPNNLQNIHFTGIIQF